MKNRTASVFMLLRIKTKTVLARSNSMAFVTSQLETLGMIEQPV